MRFEIRHRKFPERRWYLEIVGYWRPNYLREKFAKIQDAAIANFIICIDKKNACGELTEWGATGAHVIEYSKLINPQKVLEFIQRPEQRPSTGSIAHASESF